MILKLSEKDLFGITRIALAAYIVTYALLLIPYLIELYSPDGLIFRLQDSVVYNPLLSFLHLREPLAIKIVLGMQIAIAIIFGLGLYQKISAFLLWVIHIYFFNLNPYVNSPEYSYIGWLLLVFVVIPQRTGIAVIKSNSNWEPPKYLREGAWIILGVSYANSGILKALSPSWLEGTALIKIIADGVNTYFWTSVVAAAAPFLFFVLTWVVLAIEALAILFVWTNTSRKYFWIASVLMHLGILVMMKFAQVSLGMLVFHLLLFDPRWLADFRQLFVLKQKLPLITSSAK